MTLITWNKIAEVVNLVGTIIDDNKMLSFTYYSGLEEENGIWYSGEGRIITALPLKTGDIITITVSDEFTGSVYTVGGEFDDIEGTEGVFSYAPNVDDTSTLLVMENNGVDFTASIEIERDGSTYTLVNASGEIYNEKSGALNLYYGSYNGEAWESYGMRLCMDVYLEEGQRLEILPSEGFDGTITISGDNIEASNGAYYYAAPSTGRRVIDINDDSEFTANFSVEERVLGQAIAGQNTNTLTEAEHGECYVCKVTYPDGTELFSDYFYVEYVIVEQPTSAKPSVSVNFTKGASYQWYTTKEETYLAIDEDEIPGEQEKAVVYAYSGEYDSTDGMWYGAGLLDLDVELKAGETVVVTPSADFEGSVFEYDTELPLEEEFSAKIEIRALEMADAIQGETSATLAGGNYKETYICKVTWDSNVTVVSYPVTLEAMVSKQPTVGSTSFTVNFPEAVENYQWYEASVKNLDISSHVGEIDGDVIYAECFEGVLLDGVGKSEDVQSDAGASVYSNPVTDGFGFYVPVKAGDIINVAPAKSEYASVYNLSGYDNNGTIDEVAEGTYTFRIAENQSWFVLQFAGRADFELIITLTRDGKTYKADSFDYAAQDLLAGDCYMGSYADGKWYSDLDDENQILYLVAEFKTGDILRITPSEGMQGMIVIIDESGDVTLDFEKENGSYIFEVPKDGGYEIALVDINAFTAQFTVERITIGEAVKGQNSATLVANKAGSYICVATLTDGTKMVSNPVTLAESDIESGLGNADDEIKNTGDNVGLYVTFLVLGCVAIVAGLSAKKKAN